MSEACCDHETKSCAGPPPLVLPPKARDQRHDHAAEASCCSNGVPVFDGMSAHYKRVLWTVISINGAMFLTEMIAGSLAGSQALKADALDFLADTVTYGLSLAVIGASLQDTRDGCVVQGSVAQSDGSMGFRFDPLSDAIPRRAQRGSHGDHRLLRARRQSRFRRPFDAIQGR